MAFMLLEIIGILLNVVWWIIIVQAIMSWLFAFNVINTRNEIVTGIWTTLEKMTEPLYRPLRRVIPNFGALDITPMVVLVIIMILRGPVLSALYRAVISAGLA